MKIVKLLLGLMLFTLIITDTAYAKNNANDSLFRLVTMRIKKDSAKLDTEIMASKYINRCNKSIALQSSKFFNNKDGLKNYLDSASLFNQVINDHILLAKDFLKKAKKVKNKKRSCDRSLKNLELLRNEMTKIHMIQNWRLKRIKQITRGAVINLKF